MKVKRRGYKKNKGTEILANEEVPSASLSGNPKWDVSRRMLCFAVKGVDGSTTYQYHFELSAVEISRLVEAAVTQCSSDIGIRAHGKAMAAYLREVLKKQSAV